MKWTFRDKLTAFLISHMKHDDEDFIKCKRNDILIMLLNLVRVDPKEFREKLSQLIP